MFREPLRRDPLVPPRLFERVVEATEAEKLNDRAGDLTLTAYEEAELAAEVSATGEREDRAAPAAAPCAPAIAGRDTALLASEE